MQISYRWRNTTFQSKPNIEQTRFTYSTLGKAFEKQIKVTEDQGEK